MHRIVTAELDLELRASIDLIFQIAVAQHAPVLSENLTFSQGDRVYTPIEIIDQTGSRLHRFCGEPGVLEVRYDAVVDEQVEHGVGPAQVTLADGRVLETGEMIFYPYANPQTHTFRLRMRLREPNSSLFPGMLVKVSVPVASREALWVPASSLIQRSELQVVFVVDDQDQPRLRQVRTGVRDNGRLEILAGLSEGERVVANPSVLVGSDRLNPVEDTVRESNP